MVGRLGGQEVHARQGESEVHLLDVMAEAKTAILAGKWRKSSLGFWVLSCAVKRGLIKT